ncbi:hypothetical protein Tco_0465398 [Tanacetum coccineum]
MKSRLWFGSSLSVEEAQSFITNQSSLVADKNDEDNENDPYDALYRWKVGKNERSGNDMRPNKQDDSRSLRLALVDVDGKMSKLALEDHFGSKPWIQFEIHDYTRECKKEYRAAYKVLMKKEIEVPEALNFSDFGTIYGERTLQELDEFCRVSFRYADRGFYSQAWNKLFRIQESIIHEYVLEFLSTTKFKDHVVELDVNDTVTIQLGGILRRMTMRQFSLALGLYSTEEMNNNLMIARHLGLMSPVALRIVTKGQETQLLDLAKLGKLGIVRFNDVGHAEIVVDRLDDSDEEAEAAEFMDDRLGEIDEHIYKMGGEVEEITKVVSGMSEQYDQFYGEFRSMRLE